MKITIDLDYFSDEESAELSTFVGAIALAESDYKEFASHVAELTLKELQAQLQKELNNYHNNKIMNNFYDRDLLQDFLEAEQANSRAAALNVLGLLQQREHMRKTRAQAIRAQYIDSNEVTG